MHSDITSISQTTSGIPPLFSAPLFSAPACAGDTTFDWTPTPEPTFLPAPQRALCMGCPDRQRCLEWAIANDAHGIWGGTTRHQRQHTPDPELEQPIHDGPGSTSLYRRGCRCTQCRAAQAERIRQQRARRRAREEKK